MPGSSVSRKGVYRAVFVLGAGLILLSLLAGLGGELAINHRFPSLPLDDLAQANQLVDEGELDQAIAQYRVYIRIRPYRSTGFWNLGRALGRMGDTAGQIEAYERLIELNLPQSQRAATHFLLAQAYFNAERYDRARYHTDLAQKYGYFVPQEFLEELAPGFLETIVEK